MHLNAKKKLRGLGLRRRDKAVTEGTVLRAVPKPTQVSLEEMMATSPNEEILNAIREEPFFSNPIAQNATLPYSFTQQTLALSRKKSKQELKQEKAMANVVGVWKDGRVHWASGPKRQTSSVHEGTKSAPRTPSPAVRQNGDLKTPNQKSPRPRIHVVIPNSSLADGGELLPLYYEEPQRKLTPTAAKKLETRSSPAHDTAPHRISLASEITPRKPKPLRPFGNPAQAPSPETIGTLETSQDLETKRRDSSSSSISAPGDSSSSSTCSRRSSTTSIEISTFLNLSEDSSPPSPYERLTATGAGKIRDERQTQVGLGISLEQTSFLDSATATEYSNGSPLDYRSTSRARKASERFIDHQLARLSRSGSIAARSYKAARMRAEADLRRQLIVSASESLSDSYRKLILEEVSAGEGPPPPVPCKSVRRNTITRGKCPFAQTRTAANLERVREPAAIAGVTAEQVILNILLQFESLKDLFAAASINRAFYRVFKNNELQCRRSTLRKSSPAAWELRELSPPSTGQKDGEGNVLRADYTTESYVEYHRRDSLIISVLKDILLERCKGFLRETTASMLATSNKVESAPVDDALWRIWSFCELFGCGKGRENDIVGQMDWLKGGRLAHQRACLSTATCSDVIESSNILLCAPECFGRGNGDGLSAEQLYDMIELWTCLGTLLQGLQQRTEQAREYGLYDKTGVKEDDIGGAEATLEEWQYYLMSLGLSTIHDMAVRCQRSDASVFLLCVEKKWTDWAPPEHGSSRSTFLKEAVSRLYEEKVMARSSPTLNKRERRVIAQQRVAFHREEIRRRKVSGACEQVTMDTERPMSDCDKVLSALSSPQSPRPPELSPWATRPLPPLPAQTRVPLPFSSPRPPPTLPAPVRAPPPNPRANQDVALARIDEALYKHQTMLSQQVDQERDSLELAVMRIVEMGFPPVAVRHALKVTEKENNIQVIDAVELLLRG